MIILLFEDTMRESRKIASRINKMLEDEKYLKIVEKKVILMI